MTPEDLVRTYWHLAATTVRRFRLERGQRQEATERAQSALCDCALRYRPDKGKFPTYALWRIRGAVFDFLQEQPRRHTAEQATYVHSQATVNPELHVQVNQILSRLSPADALLLRRRFLEDAPQHELGSKGWISRRITRALARAREVAR